ncbi:FliI/YscN family ATPase [Pantoea cypripedii]|uniref:FliI/YscN family ATPase n=1 Tax=Pantoea cypripedii TaxID=55209 RepID=UPI002FC9F358
MEAPLTRARLGEICLIQADSVADTWRRGQVIGFKPGCAILSLFDDGQGLNSQSRVYPTGQPLCIEIGEHSLGSIYNGVGELCARMVPASPPDPARFITQWRAVDTPVVDPLRRQPINQPFYSGVRTIDGLMTCSKGQRVGIFAAAGAGKSSLLHSLLLRDSAEIIVIALIGERGREVQDFIQHGLNPLQRMRTVVVFATSDAPPIERKNAALVAMAIAEYFRDAGCEVLLLMDSITRYARALREVGFAAGEPVASSGFPASVFAELPRLLERAGPGIENGVITAFFTILLESQQGHDAVGEEVRSILDGHIYLSTKLAAANHYPAIDVLNSLSRLFSRVTTPQQQQTAGILRRALQRLDEVQLLLELGEYQTGHDHFTDKVIEHKTSLLAFLQQTSDECEEPATTLEKMQHVAKSFS